MTSSGVEEIKVKVPHTEEENEKTGQAKVSEATLTQRRSEKSTWWRNSDAPVEQKKQQAVLVQEKSLPLTPTANDNTEGCPSKQNYPYSKPLRHRPKNEGLNELFAVPPFVAINPKKQYVEEDLYKETVLVKWDQTDPEKRVPPKFPYYKKPTPPPPEPKPVEKKMSSTLHDNFASAATGMVFLSSPAQPIIEKAPEIVKTPSGAYRANDDLTTKNYSYPPHEQHSQPQISSHPRHQHQPSPHQQKNNPTNLTLPFHHNPHRPHNQQQHLHRTQPSPLPYNSSPSYTGKEPQPSPKMERISASDGYHSHFSQQPTQQLSSSSSKNEHYGYHGGRHVHHPEHHLYKADPHKTPYQETQHSHSAATDPPSHHSSKHHRSARIPPESYQDPYNSREAAAYYARHGITQPEEQPTSGGATGENMYELPSEKTAASNSETHHPRHSDYTSHPYPPTRGSSSHHHHGERGYGGELESSRYHSSRSSHHPPQPRHEKYESAPMLNDRFPDYDPQYARQRDREMEKDEVVKRWKETNAFVMKAKERHRRAALMQQQEMYGSSSGYGSSSRAKRGSHPDSQYFTDPRYSQYDATMEERYRERRGMGERFPGNGKEPPYGGYERPPRSLHHHSSSSSQHNPHQLPAPSSPASSRRHRQYPSSTAEYERMMIQRRQHAMHSSQNSRRYREARQQAEFDAFSDREARMYQREMERRKIREAEQSQYRAELGRHHR